MLYIITEKQLKKSICFKCTRYLSVLPIKVTKDKAKICGRCVKDQEKNLPGSVYETVFKNGLFRCINRYEGCNQLLTFEETQQHELQCKGKDHKCPHCKIPFPSQVLIYHYLNAHPSDILDHPSLELEPNSLILKLFIFNDIIFTFFCKYEQDLLVMIKIITPSPLQKVKTKLSLRLGQDLVPTNWAEFIDGTYVFSKKLTGTISCRMHFDLSATNSSLILAKNNQLISITDTVFQKNSMIRCSNKYSGCLSLLDRKSCHKHNSICIFDTNCPICNTNSLNSKIFIEHFKKNHELLQDPFFSILSESRRTFLYQEEEFVFILDFSFRDKLSYRIAFLNELLIVPFQMTIRYENQIFEEKSFSCHPSILKWRVSSCKLKQVKKIFIFLQFDTKRIQKIFYLDSKVIPKQKPVAEMKTEPDSDKKIQATETLNPDYILEGNSISLKNETVSLRCKNCACFAQEIFTCNMQHTLCPECKFWCPLCKDNFVSFHTEATQVLEDLLFPCKWKHCSKVLKIEELRDHENQCSFGDKGYCPVCKTAYMFLGQIPDHIRKDHRTLSTGWSSKELENASRSGIKWIVQNNLIFKLRWSTTVSNQKNIYVSLEQKESRNFFFVLVDEIMGTSTRIPMYNYKYISSFSEVFYIDFVMKDDEDEDVDDDGQYLKVKNLESRGRYNKESKYKFSNLSNIVEDVENFNRNKASNTNKNEDEKNPKVSVFDRLGPKPSEVSKRPQCPMQDRMENMRNQISSKPSTKP